MVLESNVLQDEFKPNFDFKRYHDKIKKRNAHKCLRMLLDDKISLKRRCFRPEFMKDETISEINDDANDIMPNENSSQSDISKLQIEDHIREE